MEANWTVGESMRVVRNGLQVETFPVYGDGILVAECPAYVQEERAMARDNAGRIVAQAARIRELEGALARFTEGRVPAIEKADAEWLDGFLANRRHARRILAEGGGT